eukprot:UN21323
MWKRLRILTTTGLSLQYQGRQLNEQITQLPVGITWLSTTATKPTTRAWPVLLLNCKPCKVENR